MSLPSRFLENKGPRSFTPEEEEQKRLFYERMSPRRKKFIDRIGYDIWDPFEGPKDPMDIRTDVTQRTTQQLVREFLQKHGKDRGNDYSRGALECALGIVGKEEKYLGTLDFCIWYAELLEKEKGEK